MEGWWSNCMEIIDFRWLDFGTDSLFHFPAEDVTECRCPYEYREIY